MRSLRDRLAQFDRAARPAPVAAGAEASAARAGALDSLLAVGAQWVGGAPTGHLRLEIDVHEDCPTPSGAIDEAAWSLFGARPPSGEHWVVLDTETTGLESGTGTLVFLVGLVHWTPERMWRVQLFLPEPAGEASMLEALGAELDGVDALISYNGRSFDVPRLRSRLRLQRMDATALELPHLDLVAPARRLFRRALPDVRLVTLERELLQRPRHDDLPGEFAPEVYRSLLADGEDRGLVAVLQHNAWDVERLPAVATWLARAVGPSPPAALSLESTFEVARLHALRGDAELAERLLEEITYAGARALRARARHELACLLRRQGRHAEAAEVWRRQVDEVPGDVRARVELAKLCEHRLKDLGGAHDVVLGALHVERDRRALGLRAGDGAKDDDLDRRLQRIRRKLDREGGRA